MNNRTGTVLFVLAVGVLVSGCQAAPATSPTSPSATTGALPTGALTMGALSAGTWSADALPGGVNLTPGTCGNFKWSVTSPTVGSATFTIPGGATFTMTMQVSVTGTFSATCGGGQSLSGTATASLSGTTANWSAAGNVTGSMTCPFVVTGTAAQEDGGVRVTYNATVCGTVITGSELLKKR